ncbi:type VI secretion system-associated protein TagF [Massilia endophytica]|uniref:type VI secretion system-associated protein TagF n=1 Tax=Massilia endophytica TaxID=2899220 RepID=UPI001E4E9F77|nr:type VI secretion system-associated protein TagF [Massilia endophytica]UGQ44836.1 type VI secretion system-associated protein TagF [Massilia endophytica]
MNACMHTSYFGKLPSQPDFVKAGEHRQLAGLLDEWVAAAMADLSANPRWKQHYDALPPCDFAIVGTRSRHAIGGHLAASHDRSQRRFPFVVMSLLEGRPHGSGLEAAVQAFAGFWQQARSGAAAALADGDPEPALERLLNSRPEAQESRGLDGTLGSLEEMLSGKGGFSVRGAMLGIGLLLQPFRWSGARQLERSLVLPLPDERGMQVPVAAFWLSLMAPFLSHLDLELLVFLSESEGRPVLAVGFSGASPAPLRALIDPQFAGEHQIHFNDTRWVDDLIEHDGGVLRLAACLEQGDLSIRSACAMFHETFA